MNEAQEIQPQSNLMGEALRKIALLPAGETFKPTTQIEQVAWALFKAASYGDGKLGTVSTASGLIIERLDGKVRPHNDELAAKSKQTIRVVIDMPRPTLPARAVIIDDKDQRLLPPVSEAAAVPPIPSEVPAVRRRGRPRKEHGAADGSGEIRVGVSQEHEFTAEEDLS